MAVPQVADIPFHHVRLQLDEPTLADVGGAVDDELRRCGVLIPKGGQVAIAVGSRGIANLVTIVDRVARWVAAQGATPFLVPAMGSHGGATAEGQREVLASYGLDGLGLEIRSSMGTVELPGAGLAVPVVTDAAAFAAGATIVVNRVKPHTDFHGPYESGLVKMTAIGLGKQVQAEAIHAHGTRGLRELVPAVAAHVIRCAHIVLGVGVVENALDGTMLVQAIPGDQMLEAEPLLLEHARAHLPRLPTDDIDVLLVDRMGKDISGVGMDTNVVGRTMIAGEPDPPRPRIGMLVCHRLTPASHGNATGMGIADVVPPAFAEAVDHEVTRTNVVTSGFLLRGKLPVVADDDRHAWALALRGAGVTDPASVRAVRIVDTLHCDEAWVSDAVLAELEADERVTVLARGLALHGDDGTLSPFRPA